MKQRAFDRLALSWLLAGAGVLLVALFVASTHQVILADPSAALDAHKSANVSQVSVGGEIEYTIVLTNTSSGNVTPIITDTLDNVLDYVGSSGHVYPDGKGYAEPITGGVRFKFYNPINSQEVVTLTFRAKETSQTIQIGDTITNVAVINDGTEVFTTNAVIVQISSPPTARIDTPFNGQTIRNTSGTVFQVKGVVWDTYDPAPFPSDPVLLPISNYGGGGSYYVRWNAVDTAAAYQLEESTSPSFEHPTSYNPGNAVEYFVNGKGIGTYYYRVKAFNDAGRPSRWSNVEEVHVTSTSLAYASLTPDEVTAAPVALQATPVVSVSINGGPWHAATVTAQTDYWTWSYDWTLPQENGVPYTIRAVAADSGGNLGTIDTITVTIDNGVHYVYMPLIMRRWPPVPYAPTLSASAPDANGNFTISWEYGSHPGAPVTSYTWQESQSADFSGATSQSTTATSVNLHKAPGTYYYRVRGVNSWGNGEWSNVVSVVVVSQNRVYEFSTAGDTEGWGVKRDDRKDGEDPAWYRVKVLNVSSEGPALYTYLHGRFDFLEASPMQEGPEVPYTINARVKFINNESIDGWSFTAKNETAYGILFGGNNGTPCPAGRTTPKDTGCLEHFYRLLVVYNQGQGNFVWNLKRLDYHDPNEGGKPRGVTLIDYQTVQPGDALGWNEWKVVVTNDASNNIKVYLNNKLIGQATEHTYLNDRYFGTWLNSPDFGDVGAKWDWFRVERQ